MWGYGDCPGAEKKLMLQDTVSRPGPGHMHGCLIVVEFTVFCQLWRIPFAIPLVRARQILVNILCQLRSWLGRRRGREGGNKKVPKNKLYFPYWSQVGFSNDKENDMQESFKGISYSLNCKQGLHMCKPYTDCNFGCWWRADTGARALRLIWIEPSWNFKHFVS